MLTKSDNKKTGELLYLCLWFLLFGTRCFNITDASPAYRFIVAGAGALFLAKLIITRHSLKEYLIITILMGIALAVYANTGEKGILLYFMLMLGMKNVRIRPVLVSGAVMMGLSLCWHVFTRVFWLLPEFYYYSSHTGAEEFRHSLGFPHPTTLQLNCMIFTMLVMLAVSNCRRQVRIAIGAALALFDVYVYFYSTTRTSLIITFLFFFLYTLFLERKKPFNLFERILLQLVYPLCGIAATAVILLMSDEAAQKLVDYFGTLGSRATLAKYYLTVAPLSLFGHRIDYSTVTTAYGIDEAYCNLLILNGVVAFVVISALYLWYIHDAVYADRKEGTENNTLAMAELAVVLSIVVMGLTEQFLFNLSCKNLCFLFFGEWLFRKTSGEVLEENGNNVLRRKRSYLDDGEKTEGDQQAASLRTALTNDGIAEGCEAEKEGSQKQSSNVLLIRMGIVFVTFFLLVFLVYLHFVPEPVMIYADSDHAERYEIGGQPYYFTEEEIKDLKAQDVWIERYGGPTVPMYQYDDVIAVKEYQRMGVSLAFWTGCASAAILRAAKVVWRRKSNSQGEDPGV